MSARAAASSISVYCENVGIADAGCVVIATVLALFARFVSVFVVVTVAVFETVPSIGGSVTMRAMAALALGASVPSEHVTVVVPLHVPCDGVADRKAAPAGRVSVTVVFRALPGPLLVTVIV